MTPTPNQLALLISLIGVGLSQPVRAMSASSVLLEEFTPPASSHSAGSEYRAGALLVPGQAYRTLGGLQLALPAAPPDSEAGSPPTPPGSPRPPDKAPAGGKHLIGTADPAKRGGAGPPRLALVDADPPDDLNTPDDAATGQQDGVPGEHGPGDEPGAVLTSVTAIEPLPDPDAVMRTLAAVLMAEPPDDWASVHAPAQAATPSGTPPRGPALRAASSPVHPRGPTPHAPGEHAGRISSLADTVAPEGPGPSPADAGLHAARAMPPSPMDRAAQPLAGATQALRGLDGPIAGLQPAATAPHREMRGLSRLITELDPWGYPYQREWHEADGEGNPLAHRDPSPAPASPSAPLWAAAPEAPSSDALGAVDANSPSPGRAHGLPVPDATVPAPAPSQSEKVLSILEAVLSPDWAGPSHAGPTADDAPPAPVGLADAAGAAVGDTPPGERHLDATPEGQSSKVLSTLAEVLSPGWAGPSHAQPTPEETTRPAGSRKQAAGSAPEAAPWLQPSPFGRSAVAVREDELGDVRGGFTTPDGLKISFGIERAVYVNGSLVATTSLNMSELGTISGGHDAGAGLPPSAMAIIQNGTGNTFQTGPVSAGALGTVIQNTLNDQKIESITVINATVNSLGILKSMDTQSALRGAIIDSLRR